MCLDPIIMRDGTEVACRKCDRCRRNRINDWVGRCIAESRYATDTHSVTLTYGRDDQDNPDHLHAALLIYSDMQNFFKRLRKAGYRFKYLVAGEYGGERRRAHWHLIIFWLGAVPHVEMRQNFHFEFWEHGHTFWEPMTDRSVWYVCKYIQKEQADDEAESMLRMSKKPPLGHEYFQKWARQHVAEGLAPQSLHYTFSDIRHKDGSLRQFFMRGVTADNFLREYCREFVRQKGHLKMPHSDLVAEWIDDRYAEKYEMENWARRSEHGSSFIETFKKQKLLAYCEAAGEAVVHYERGYHPCVEPFARCQSGNVIHYDQAYRSPDPVAEFLSAIDPKNHGTGRHANHVVQRPASTASCDGDDAEFRKAVNDAFPSVP